jgi:hypothetical protein
MALKARRRIPAWRVAVPFSPELLQQLIDALGGLDAAARAAGVSAARVRYWLREGRLTPRRLRRLMVAYRAKQRGLPPDVF